MALPLDSAEVQKVPAPLESARRVCARAETHHRTHDPPVAFDVALQYLKEKMQFNTNIYLGTRIIALRKIVNDVVEPLLFHDSQPTAAPGIF